jgi:hypothetical protein
MSVLRQIKPEPTARSRALAQAMNISISGCTDGSSGRKDLAKTRQ